MPNDDMDMDMDMDMEQSFTVRCSCGRMKSELHCVSCGKKNIRAVKKDSRTDVTPNGRVRIMGFVCNACGHRFVGDSVCSAPPPKLGRVPRVMSEEQKEFNRLPKALRDKAVLKSAKLMTLLMKKDPVRYGNKKLMIQLEEEVHSEAVEKKQNNTITDITDDPFFSGDKK